MISIFFLKGLNMRVLKPFVPVLAIACLMFCGAFASLAYASENADGKMTLAESCQHNWSSWEIYDDADCENEGIEGRSCVLCWEIETRVIKKRPHTWTSWNIDKAATKFAVGKKSRSCLSCGKEERNVSVPKLRTTDTDKAVLKAMNKFFTYLKRYDYQKIRTVYRSKTHDCMRGAFKNIYRKQFRKKLSFKYIDISSGSKNAVVKVRLTTPYGYSRYIRAYNNWTWWCLAKYPNVSESAAKQNLLNRLVKSVSGNKMYKVSGTISIKLKKYSGKWKVVPSSNLKKRMDGGFMSAYRDFKRMF